MLGAREPEDLLDSLRVSGDSRSRALALHVEQFPSHFIFRKDGFIARRRKATGIWPPIKKNSRAKLILRKRMQSRSLLAREKTFIFILSGRASCVD